MYRLVLETCLEKLLVSKASKWEKKLLALLESSLPRFYGGLCQPDNELLSFDIPSSYPFLFLCFRLCPVCNAPFTDASFARYPNGLVTHKHCAKNKYVCPVTGKLFSTPPPRKDSDTPENKTEKTQEFHGSHRQKHSSVKPSR